MKANWSRNKTCPDCGNPIENRATRCRKCNAKANSSLISVDCPICHKTVKREPWYMKRVKHTACSKECTGLLKTKFYSGDKASNWQGGKVDADYKLYRKTPKYMSWVKEQIIKRGGRCENCGATHKVQIHHIIPVAKAPEYMLLNENLVALCERCHKPLHSKNRELANAYFLKDFEDKVMALNIAI